MGIYVLQNVFSCNPSTDHPFWQFLLGAFCRTLFGATALCDPPFRLFLCGTFYKRFVRKQSTGVHTQW